MYHAVTAGDSATASGSTSVNQHNRIHPRYGCHIRPTEVMVTAINYPHPNWAIRDGPDPSYVTWPKTLSIAVLSPAAPT